MSNASRAILLVFVSALVLIGCESENNFLEYRPPRNESSVTISQGLWGDVWFWQGDFMPPETGTVRPCAREVVVFEIATLEDLTRAEGAGSRFFSEVRTEEIARTTSRVDGFFELALPPGEYSVFVVEGSMYYSVLGPWYNNLSRAVVYADSVAGYGLNIKYLASF